MNTKNHLILNFIYRISSCGCKLELINPTYCREFSKLQLKKLVCTKHVERNCPLMLWISVFVLNIALILSHTSNIPNAYRAKERERQRDARENILSQQPAPDDIFCWGKRANPMSQTWNTRQQREKVSLANQLWTSWEGGGPKVNSDWKRRIASPMWREETFEKRVKHSWYISVHGFKLVPKNDHTRVEMWSNTLEIHLRWNLEERSDIGQLLKKKINKYIK